MARRIEVDEGTFVVRQEGLSWEICLFYFIFLSFSLFGVWSLEGRTNLRCCSGVVGVSMLLGVAKVITRPGGSFHVPVSMYCTCSTLS